MEMDVDAVDREAFARSYNRRRTAAKAAAYAVAGYAVLEAAYRLYAGTFPSGTAWAAGLVLVLAGYAWFGWLGAHCPFCRRFIGLRPRGSVGLSRGAPCALETELEHRLDLPDHGWD